MRRMRFAALVMPLAFLVSAGPVAADTTPGGGSGTFFSSGFETCSTSGGKQVCTDTTLYIQPNEDGSSSDTCLDIFTTSRTSSGRDSFVSDAFGCTAGSNMTIGSDYSVTVAPTTIPLQTCKAHKRQCSGASNATVSASDTLTGPVSRTTTRSTTVQGGCTIRTTTNETFGGVAGTMTVNGVTSAEQGSFDIVDSTTTVRCK